MKKTRLKLTAVFLVCAIICVIACPKVMAEETALKRDFTGISAQAYALIEATSGSLLAGSNEEEVLPMASTTKIMTALLVLEIAEKQNILDESFTVLPEDIKIEGSSMGLLPGDSVTLRDLCYGMLLSSGNDAANAAAIRISGSVEEFAKLMNARAGKIGMSSTNFVNPAGLHNEEHYSTAFDMAMLTREALQNKIFREICASKKAKLSFGNPPYERWLSNHNKLLGYYDGCIGVKTGFTEAAGRCLVSAVERNGAQLICVTLNAPNDWSDHTALYDYGLEVVSADPITPNLTGITAKLVGGETDEVELTAQKAVPVFVSGEERKRLTQRVLLRQFYYAPIKSGDVVGEVQILLDGKIVGKAGIIVR